MDRFNMIERLWVAAACVVLSALCWPARASDCEVTSVGLTPINDLGTDRYLEQFVGGLYPQGSNAVPGVHAAAGLNRAMQVEPLNPAGAPDPDGQYVLLSIGMSNTTQEFCSQSGQLPCDPWTFMGQAAAHQSVNIGSLAIVNGARGGQAASTWDAPDDMNYDRVRDQVLAPQGLSEAQVQIVWAKVANAGPQISLPSLNSDAWRLVEQMGDISRALRVRYPHLKMVFFSSRIYAGYASTPLNPEPYAYESAFAVKWLIQAQIAQMNGGPMHPRAGDMNYDTVAPWVAWGPYLWADGLMPRSDGLIWECDDFQNDGTHPARDAEEKVGTMLLDFMLHSPFTQPWFTVAVGDWDGDGDVDIEDYEGFLDCVTGPAGDISEGCGAFDFDFDGDVDFADAGALQAAFTGGL